MLCHRAMALMAYAYARIDFYHETEARKKVVDFKNSTFDDYT